MSTPERDELMATFLAGVSTDEMKGHTIMSWLAAKSQEQIDQLEASQAGSSDEHPLAHLQRGPLSAMAAQLFALEFQRVGAINYYELKYHMPEVGDFTVTIQRCEGETLNQQLEAQLEEARKTISELEESAAQMESSCEHYKGLWQGLLNKESSIPL